MLPGRQWSFESRPASGKGTLYRRWRWDVSCRWTLYRNREPSIGCQLSAWNVGIMEWVRSIQHYSSINLAARVTLLDVGSSFREAAFMLERPPQIVLTELLMETDLLLPGFYPPGPWPRVVVLQ